MYWEIRKLYIFEKIKYITRKKIYIQRSERSQNNGKRTIYFFMTLNITIIKILKGMEPQPDP